MCVCVWCLCGRHNSVMKILIFNHHSIHVRRDVTHSTYSVNNYSGAWLIGVCVEDVDFVAPCHCVHAHILPADNQLLIHSESVGNLLFFSLIFNFTSPSVNTYTYWMSMNRPVMPTRHCVIHFHYQPPIDDSDFAWMNMSKRRQRKKNITTAACNHCNRPQLHSGRQIIISDLLL